MDACKVEYAWWKYPSDKLAIEKKYFNNEADARVFCQYLADRSYYNWRIVKR